MAAKKIKKTPLTARFVVDKTDYDKACALEIFFPADRVEDRAMVELTMKDHGWAAYKKLDGEMMSICFVDKLKLGFAWRGKHEEQDGMRRAKAALKKLKITSVVTVPGKI